MIKILFIKLSMLFSLFCSAQGEMSPYWVKTDSSIHGLSEAWGVDVDANHHIYWIISNNLLNQGLDIHGHKLDSDGNDLWPTTLIYGGKGTQHAYVCNASDSSSLYVGGRSCTGLVNTCDMLLLKLDKKTGDVIWDRTKNFNADGYDEVDGLEIKSDGIYCGGWGQELVSGIYKNDLGLWKLDFDGNTEWTNFFGDEMTAEHQDGHFVVDENYIYAAGLWGGKGIGNLFNGHSLLAKFSKKDGSLIDSTLFGHHSNNFNDIENALGMASDGKHLYITGYTTPKKDNDWQIFVAKFDKDLNQMWFLDWGGEGSESARAISVENDKIYVAGLTESESLMTGGTRDALLLVLDKQGNVLSYQTYGSSEKEAFEDIAVYNGNIYMTGRVELPKNKTKSLLVALKDINISIHQENPPRNFTIYPSPSSGIINVEIDEKNNQEGEIKIFDMAGIQIFSRNLKKENQKLSFHLPYQGVFKVQLVFKDYRITKSILNIR